MLLLSRTVWSWLAIFMGVAMGIAKLDAFQRLLFGGGNEYSLFTRVEAWKILGEIIQRNPLLGLGPANYYWYTPLYPILGYAVQFNSHNNYVDIIAQTGLLGLLAFLWFAGELAWLGYRLLDKVPTGFAQSYAFAALGGLVATLTAGMLGDWFFPFVYNIGLNGFRASIVGWLFLGGLVALHEMNQVNLEGVK
jgi:O-antigen ligase